MQHEQKPPRLKEDQTNHSGKTDAVRTDVPASDSEQAPKKAIENFWYHYKWPTLIIGFFAVFLIIAIAQMSGREEWDAHVLYTGPAYLDREICESMLSSIAEVSESAASAEGTENPADYTKDGVLTVDLNKFIYVPQNLAEDYRESDIYFNGQNNLSARGDFDNAIVIGEYVILLIDRSLYEETVDTGAFLKWEDSLGERPEKAIDDYGILLSDLSLSTLNGFRQLPEDTVVCCRGKSYANRFNKKVQNPEMYQAQVALFRQLVTYERKMSN